MYRLLEWESGGKLFRAQGPQSLPLALGLTSKCLLDISRLVQRLFKLEVPNGLFTLPVNQFLSYHQSLGSLLLTK